MGANSKIEWTDASWNPAMGCTPISEGCTNCYARAMMKRYAGRKGWPEHPGTVTLFPERLEQPLRWKKLRTVFVCSMSDLFHPEVPFNFITEVFDVMCDARSQKHIFQVLTKRPERISEWLNWVAEYWPGDSPFSIAWEVLGHAPNVHLGVTAENQEAADKRIPLLLQTPAAVRFVSIEPMLEQVDLSFRCLECNKYHHYYELYCTEGDCPTEDCEGGYYQLFEELDWVIVGGETGPNARPMNPDWARDIRDQCRAAGVPFFFKQMSNKQPIPEDLRIREMPGSRYWLTN